MKISTQTILNALKVLIWILFIGSCIKTGALLFSFVVSIVVNEAASNNLYMGLNLSELYQYNMSYYLIMIGFILYLAAMKTYILYQLIKIFTELNLVHPFSEKISRLVSEISVNALVIGIVSLIGEKFWVEMIKQGVKFPNLNEYLGGAAEFLLLGGIIFVIAQVFKRGIELQSESELTI